MKRALICMGIILILLLAALLAYDLATFSDWMAPEHSTTVIVDIPNTENQLCLDEYAEFRSGYFDIYLRVPGKEDRLLDQGEFNEPFCPIRKGKYEIEFGENTATLYYPFSAGSDRENWKEISLDLTP